jgi:hypothetical protein
MKIITECSEFTIDMFRGLPRAYYCSINNIDHVCHVKKNLTELYSLVSNNVVEGVQFRNMRGIDHPDDMYEHTDPVWSNNEWIAPPLKDMFKGYLKFDKPTVVINNKCSVEHEYQYSLDIASKNNYDISLDQIIQLGNENRASINHYSIPMLSKLIDMLSDKYQILYIRPITTAKYFLDTNTLVPFNDFEFLEKNYPHVYTIKQFLEETNLTTNYTIAQFMFEATSDRHLSIMGGNAAVSAYFGGDLIIYEWEGHRKNDRGVWKTDSWLKKFSNSNVIGLDNYDKILNYVAHNWL